MRKDRWRLIGENIRSDHHGLRLNRFGKKSGRWGPRLLLIVVLGFFLSRAVFLQLVLGAHNQVLAEGNRIEVKLVAADRGVIEDRQGQVLARNGLNVNQKVVREYPFGEVGVHVIGYVGAVTPAELEECQKKLQVCRLSGNQVVGKMGVEKTQEEWLRGVSGERLVETDAAGRDARLISQRVPTAGEVVRLNLDIGLEKAVVGALAARASEKFTRGAVVVSRVNTNEVLALVSWPEFDPNLFSGSPGQGGYGTVEGVLGDQENQPLFNRATAGLYPPGSVFKLVTATAALETGSISPDTLVEDTGELKVGDYRYGTWNFDQHGNKEGNIGLVRALVRSNDIFFYKAGEWTGVENLKLWSNRLGLGAKTGIELSGEEAGVVPDPVVKERETGERWFLGNTYHLAIGQGDLLVTPLQVNRMTAAVVSGLWCQPRLTAADPRAGCRETGVNQAHRQLILTGMVGACASGGTAFPLFDFQPQLACKTGTAQHGGENIEPHAWISVVVPASGNTQLERFENGLVITVLLEDAGEGSYEAAPVASIVAEYITAHQL